jgi:hypothetical protein
VFSAGLAVMAVDRRRDRESRKVQPPGQPTC